jgi:hypothetical protein
MTDRAQVLFPFPLVDSPPRSALRGLVLPVFGTTLVVVGMLGGGLATSPAFNFWQFSVVVRSASHPLTSLFVDLWHF